MADKLLRRVYTKIILQVERREAEASGAKLKQAAWLYRKEKAILGGAEIFCSSEFRQYRYTSFFVTVG